MATLDTRLPLMVQQPDFVNVLARSNVAAQQANQMRDQNALRQLYQTQGAGIAAGDQNALNALARLDPMAAMGVQDARQQMQARTELMGQRRAEAERQAQAYAASISAQEAAREAAELDRQHQTATGFALRGDVNGLNQTLEAMGYPPVESVEQYEAEIAPMSEVAASILKRRAEVTAGPKPADEYQRYVQEEQAAGRTPLGRIEFSRAKQKSSSIEMSPDGTVRITEGAAAGGLPKTTEGEKSAAGYLSRMRASEELLDELSEEGPAVRSIASLLVGGSNFEGLVLSERQQRIMQAQRDWVRAKLRKESGAVIGADEMAEEIRTYFPLPGEDDAVVEQKRRARKEAERQFEIMSGAAAPQADRPQQPAGDQRQEVTSGGPQVGAVEDGYRFKGGDPANPNSWEKVN